MADRTAAQAPSALLAQFLNLFGVSRPPVSKDQATETGRNLRRQWTKSPDQRLQHARRNLGPVTMDLGMLTQLDKGGRYHGMACTVIKELGQVPQPQEEELRDVYDEVMVGLQQAVA